MLQAVDPETHGPGFHLLFRSRLVPPRPPEAPAARPQGAAARSAIFEWIEVFYNRERLHETLDYVSPVGMKSNELFLNHVSVETGMPHSVPISFLSGVFGRFCQFAEYSVVGAKRICSSDISSEPSFALGFRLTFPAAAAYIFNDCLLVVSPRDFGIHAGTLQHAYHAAL